MTEGIDFKFLMEKGYDDLKPTKKHRSDTGWDIRAKTDGFIHGGSFATIKTGVSVDLPSGYGMQVRGRSGLAAKGVYVAMGTIDNGYKGEIGVNVFTLNPRGFSWDRGDRIAQLVLEKVLDYEDDDESERGENGFGSSGIK
jgi:dUTP pyrophosphatase